MSSQQVVNKIHYLAVYLNNAESSNTDKWLTIRPYSYFISLNKKKGAKRFKY